MTLSFRDLEFRAKAPEIPSAMPAAITEGQCAHDRVETMRALADILQVGDAIDVALPFGHALAGKTGQVEFFAASGAVRGRNLEVLNRFEDERREWPDVKEIKDRDGIAYTLGERSSRHLLEQAREVLSKAGLADDGVDGTDVVLGRWAELDERGRERQSGPGRATVQLSYAVEGTRLIGPGAKTNLHFDPIDGAPALARMFHVHRAVVDVREVRTEGTEGAFQALLDDPFLVRQAARGGHVVITAVQAGLLALPADAPQRVAYPALAVEGTIQGLKEERKGDVELRFGRYVPAVPPEALRRAGLAVPAPTADTGKSRPVIR